MTDYQRFLQSKKQIAISSGFEKPKDQMCADMFEWQKDIVYWALRKGTSSIEQESLFDI